MNKSKKEDSFHNQFKKLLDESSDSIQEFSNFFLKEVDSFLDEHVKDDMSDSDRDKKRIVDEKIVKTKDLLKKLNEVLK